MQMFISSFKKTLTLGERLKVEMKEYRDEIVMASPLMTMSLGKPWDGDDREAWGKSSPGG